MITDPWFYAAAIPAVALVGLSKGGFGGSLSLLALPLLSLAIPTMQAAGIMLPILLAMDAVAVVIWRKIWHKKNLMILIPAGTAGTVIGYLTASIVEDGHIRLMVGSIGLMFTLDHAWRSWRGTTTQGPPKQPNWLKGSFWGVISGFTSFISHVGGPPLQVYLLPQRISKEVFAGTLTMFFAYINVIKVAPFFALGQLNPTNLTTSAVLVPLAIVSTMFGGWLVKRVPARLFFTLIYSVLFIVSLKLVYDGVRMTFGGP